MTSKSNDQDVINGGEEDIYEVDPNHPARPMEALPYCFFW